MAIVPRRESGAIPTDGSVLNAELKVRLFLRILAEEFGRTDHAHSDEHRNAILQKMKSAAEP
jgi:hypothetical protein